MNGGEQNSHDHLLAAQKGVANELARAQSHGRVGVRHLCDCDAEDRPFLCKLGVEGETYGGLESDRFFVMISSRWWSLGPSDLLVQA
jgi:hypothetical protein